MMDLLQTEKEKKISDFSQTDKLIIREFIKNPQSSILKISKNIDKTRQTISKFYKNLLKRNVINFSININYNCLNLDYFLIKVELKRNIDVDYFLNLFHSCPKTLFVFKSVINNQIIALIFDEYNTKISKNDSPCSCLIEKIQMDPRVNSCNIEGVITKIIPKFIPLDSRRISKDCSKAPCEEYCDVCPKYMQSCLGCPATRYYKGNFSF
ncbi:MAG: winged helix-turn-helix transcriptional regulator [Candidatus Helarchaeota archaeon]